MLKNIFIVLFSFFFFCFSKGQDSLQKSLEKRLVEFSNQRKEDSIKRIELENKFAGIQITSKEKESLLKELKFLKSRDSIVTKRYKDKIDSLRLINKGVPVVPFHDTLFIVYRGVGGFTMKERARSIEEKIIELAKSYDFNKDSIKVSSDENQYLIYSDEDIIASVGLQDALWENTSLDKLSDKYANVIADSIEKHRSDVSLPTLAKGTLYAILLISVVSFLIF